MASNPRRKPHLLAGLLLLLLAGAASLFAFQHYGAFSMYVNGQPVRGPGAWLGLAGVVALGGIFLFCLFAWLGLFMLGALLLVGGAFLFAAAPLLLPLVFVAAIVYLLMFGLRRR
jgi:hypothetical protein